MRLLLIQPYRDNSDGRIVMPIGLMSIASCVKQELGWDVEIYDEILDGLLTKKDIDCDFVGISCPVTTQERRTWELLKKFKEIDREITTIVGGHQATFTMQENELIDHVVRGPGEGPILKILGDVDKIYTMDSLPLPAYDIIDVQKYYDVHKSETIYSPYDRIIQYETSRGCSFNCSFCASKRFWKKWEGKSPFKVISELEYLYQKFDFQDVDFMDANLLNNKNRAKDIMRLFSKSLPDCAWSDPGGTWVGGLDKEMLDLMKAANCYQLTFPIESTDKKILKNYNIRKIDLDHIEAMAKYCHEIDIPMHAFLIAGFPGQTKTDIDKDMDFVRKLDFESVSIHLLTQLPGTDIQSEHSSFYESDRTDMLDYIMDITKKYNRELYNKNRRRYLEKYYHRGFDKKHI